MKTLPRESIVGCLEQRLPVRFAASESVEADDILVQIDIGSDQPMRPGGIDGEVPSQQSRLATVVGASQEDHLSVEFGLEVELPVVREWVSSGRAVDPGCRPTSRNGLSEDDD